MYKRGTVVLVSFPFTDLLNEKVRPAVIVSARNHDNDVVIAMITSRASRAEPVDLSLKESNRDFATTGLKKSSVIRVHKLATVDKKIVLGELGHLSGRLVKELDRKLKMVFGLV